MFNISRRRFRWLWYIWVGDEESGSGDEEAGSGEITNTSGKGILGGSS